MNLLPADYDSLIDDAFAYQSRKLLRRIKEAYMQSRIYCRQCGYAIVRVDWINRNRAAQDNGFCCKGCETVYEEIKRRTKEDAA